MADQVLDFGAFASDPSEIDSALREAGDSTILQCGYILPEERTKEVTKRTDAIIAAMPRFGIRGRFKADQREYQLWKAAYELLGKHPTYVYQTTGSCVGAGACQMIITAQAVDIRINNKPQEFTTVWWPFHYGMGRFRTGIGGRGEGSTGSGQAKALLEDGTFEDDGSGQKLPDYTIKNNWLTLPAKIELDWSNGKAIAQEWKDRGKKHLFKTAARMKSAEDVAEALMNGYPITCASDFGFSPMTPAVKGDPKVRLVEQWNANWSHQMSIHGYWDHPTLGEIFYWMNNWGPDAHGSPIGDEPPGGFYTTKTLLNQILKSRNCECYAFSQYDGFPAQDLNFSAF